MTDTLTLRFSEPVTGEDADVIYTQVRWLHDVKGHPLADIGLFAQLMTVRHGRHVTPHYTCAADTQEG